MVCHREGVICDVSIKPPIAKKILPEGESHPIAWKDYPIYFYMGVNARFTIKATNENMVNFTIILFRMV